MYYSLTPWLMLTRTCRPGGHMNDLHSLLLFRTEWTVIFRGPFGDPLSEKTHLQNKITGSVDRVIWDPPEFHPISFARSFNLSQPHPVSSSVGGWGCFFFLLKISCSAEWELRFGHTARNVTTWKFLIFGPNYVTTQLGMSPDNRNDRSSLQEPEVFAGQAQLGDAKSRFSAGWSGSVAEWWLMNQ